MPISASLTIAEAVERALAAVDGPIDLDTFLNRIQTIRPSSAKDPTASVRTHLKMNEEGRSMVYLDRKTIVPLRVAVPGLRFRIPLSRQEVTRGVLMTRPSFEGWVTHNDDPQTFEFVDERGKPLPTRTVSIRRKRTGLLGNYEVQEQAFDFVNWFKARRAGRNDSILATWESWEPKRFRLELESAKRRRRHRDEIARKNQELADILFDLLESSANEQIYVRSAISTAYLRLSNPHGYPGDHWIEIVDQDERLKWSDMSITYPERRSPLEFVLAEGESVVDEEPFTPEQAEKVYRFKAALKHRKGLWRRVEIQGGQTLADLDSILRDAFDHDSMDHLGGFWKLVRRGQSRRFREINLGDVHPFGGGGSAEDLRIAGLELQVGDRLRAIAS